jgi:hypothetical protein
MRAEFKRLEHDRTGIDSAWSTVSRFAVVGRAGILLPVLLFAGCAYGPGQDADRNNPKSDTTILREDMKLFPTGKRLYWIGPKVAGFTLAAAVMHGDSAAEGVKFLYVHTPGTLEVLTYLGPTRPAPGQPDDYATEDDRRTLARRVTPTGQLVLLVITPPTAEIPASVVSKLVAAIQPVSERDVDDLPSSWRDLRR